MIIHGDALEELKKLEDNSIDSVVTDPPYGLSKEPDIVEVLTKWINGEPYDHKHGGFMGKKWDSFVPHPDIWKEVYRVLKPGGHALVFAGTRTQDLMTIALRLAGFEVRDVIEWLYFTGFPKSYNISKAFDRKAGAKREVVSVKKSEGGRTGKNPYQSEDTNFNGDGAFVEITAPATDLAKQWEGWGTALKPAHEPIIMVRKPLEVDGRKATIIDNVKEHGTGGLNVDDCKIGDGTDRASGGKSGSTAIWNEEADNKRTERPTGGRFPSNCITLEDDQFYSKYFNVSPKQLSKKASKKDRNSDWQGNEIDLPEKRAGGMQATVDGSMLTGSGNERKTKYRNTHPTVKPTELMAWLVRLVTPPNGTVLDPFTGSGSTLVAAKREGFEYVGIEITDEYIPIIEARLKD